MDNSHINQSLIAGELKTPGVLPHLEQLTTLPVVFEQNFGLDELPIEPGIILIRGPRQYGKSTWLEQHIAKTIKTFGKGTALYLNGDEIKDSNELLDQISILIQLFSPKAKVKRLFIDEITAIVGWEKAIKRLADAGILKNILVVTTGSKAADLRRGIERLPGRKGKLSRTNYIFTPVSYKEFKQKCENIFKEDTLFAYILSGGSPVGANALVEFGRIPEYVNAIVSDWVFGEFAASGRSRAHLLAVLQILYRLAGTPIGQAKLARESGLSNNTIAQGYIELLSDLITIIPSFPFDPQKQTSLFRKPSKYHFINLLAALCWHPQKPRTILELKNLNKDLGPVFEWVVAQEISRKLCISSADLPTHLNFWQSKDHEIDFFLPDQSLYLEVKVGQTSPTEFLWFLKSFKKEYLLVISKNRFETERIIGITLEDFLLKDTLDFSK